MTSKAELEKKYSDSCALFTVRRDPAIKKFSKSYFAKALHNVELAGIVDMVSRDDDTKRLIRISPASEFFDWVIITSYYAMYLAATSALAHIAIKATTHGSTVLALEYWYCFKKNLLPRKYVDMIERAQFGKEDIHSIDSAMRGRVLVQYTISTQYGRREAARILSDARAFVSKVRDIVIH